MKFSQSGSQNGVYTSQEKLFLLGFLHKRLTLILSCSVHFRSISHVTHSDLESFQCLTNLFLQVWRELGSDYVKRLDRSMLPHRIGSTLNKIRAKTLGAVMCERDTFKVDEFVRFGHKVITIYSNLDLPEIWMDINLTEPGTFQTSG